MTAIGSIVNFLKILMIWDEIMHNEQGAHRRHHGSAAGRGSADGGGGQAPAGREPLPGRGTYPIL